ncbi:MAG: IS3 family transposase, partial [Oscillospiraceae bacterium]
KFDNYESLAAAIEEYIHFYNYNRRQKKLKCLSPTSYRQLLENAA